MSRIYLAGPMSNLPEMNYPAFNAVAAKLRAEGHHVENPAEAVECVTWEAYMRLAIAQLITCDTIVMLSGWGDSRGAKIEYRLAGDLGLRIHLCGVVANV